MLLVVKASGNPDFLAYRNNILFRQTVTRYGASWHHVAPWYDYIVSVIPGFWLPVSLLLPWLVVLPWFKAVREGDRRITLLLGYLVLVLIFFSCSAGKRGVYILPAVPALVLATAPYLPELLERPWPRRPVVGIGGSPDPSGRGSAGDLLRQAGTHRETRGGRSPGPHPGGLTPGPGLPGGHDHLPPLHPRGPGDHPGRPLAVRRLRNQSRHQ